MSAKWRSADIAVRQHFVMWFSSHICCTHLFCSWRTCLNHLSLHRISNCAAHKHDDDWRGHLLCHSTKRLAGWWRCQQESAWIVIALTMRNSPPFRLPKCVDYRVEAIVGNGARTEDDFEPWLLEEGMSMMSISHPVTRKSVCGRSWRIATRQSQRRFICKTPHGVPATLHMIRYGWVQFDGSNCLVLFSEFWWDWETN